MNTQPYKRTESPELRTPAGHASEAHQHQSDATSTVSCASELSVAGFILGEEIARGGMGVVYRGRDVSLNREVAIKVLQDKFPADGSAARRFLEEAQITGQLQHPGIPPIHHVGTLPNGRPFLAMKLIKGRTLDDLLRNRDGTNFVAVFEQIAHAVGYAHAHGVIHRDLKPANVMVGAFGEVQVMDWGLAKVLASGGRQFHESADAEVDAEIRSPRENQEETGAGSVLGTPAYMPPEQAIGAIEHVDAQSDVFGLGAILCAILTGRPPYRGNSAEQTWQLAARAKLDDAFAHLDAMSAEPDLIALCKCCLSAEKSDRPADANAVAQHVAALRTAADERAKQAELDRTRAEVQAAEQHKRRRVFVFAGRVLAVVLLVVIGDILDQYLRLKRAQENTAEALDRIREVLDATTTAITGDSLTQKEFTPDQKKFLAAVLTYYKKFAGTEGDGELSRKWRADAEFRVGLIEIRLGNSAGSFEGFRMARDEFQQLASDFPDTPEYRWRLASCHHNLGHRLYERGQRSEALDQYRQGIAIQEQLALDFRIEAELQIELGYNFCNFGNVKSDGGKPEESLMWFRKAIGTLTALLENEPTLLRASQLLRNSYAGRAMAYVRLGKYGDAVQDWDNAVELSSKEEQPGYRVSRATSRLHFGLVIEAIAEVAELTKSETWNADQWYNFARVYAVASNKIDGKKQEYADRAMELLQKAVKAGYKDVGHMAKDMDLNPLRGRADFKKLLESLPKPKEASKP